MADLAEVVRDPEFATLSAEDQRQVLAELDADFGGLDPRDQSDVLMQIRAEAGIAPRDRSAPENVWEGLRAGVASSLNTAANVAGIVGAGDTLRDWSRAAAPTEPPEPGILSAIERGLGASIPAIPEWMAAAAAGSALGGSMGGSVAGPPGAAIGAIVGGVAGPTLLGAAQRMDQGAGAAAQGAGTNAAFATLLQGVANLHPLLRVPVAALANVKLAQVEDAPFDEQVAQAVLGGVTAVAPEVRSAAGRVREMVRPRAAVPVDAPEARPVAPVEAPPAAVTPDAVVPDRADVTNAAPAAPPERPPLVPPGTPGRGFGRDVHDTTPKWEHSAKILGRASETFMRKFLDDPKFAADLEVQRRGKLSEPQIARLAERVGMTVEDYTRLAQGSILPAENQAHLASLIHGHLRVMRDMDGALEAARRANHPAEVARLDAHRQSVEAQVGKLLLTLEASRSEAGRTLGQRLLGPGSSRLYRQGLRLIMESDAIPDGVREKLTARLARATTDAERIAAIREAYMPGWWEKFREWRVNSLLSSPLTVMRNLVGNSLATATRLAENVTGALVDAPTRWRRGTPGHENHRRAIEIRDDLFGTLQGLKSGARAAMRALTDENYAISRGRSAADVRHLPAIEGRHGQVIRFPSRVSAAADVLFYEMNAEGRRWQMASRTASNEGLRGDARVQRMRQLVQESRSVERETAERMMRGQLQAKTPAERIAAEAHRSGLEFTFQSDLGAAGSTAQRMLNADIAPSRFLKTLVPFFRTPVNITKFVAQRSVFGLLSPRNLADVKGGGQAARDAIARIALGTTVQGALTAFALEGRISGAPPTDPKDRAALEATGWQPYSIRLGDNWYSYRGFSPLSEHLAMAAEVARSATKNPSGTDVATALLRGGAAMARTTVNQPYLTQVGDLVDVLQRTETESGEATALRMLGRFAGGIVVPRGVAYVGRQMDDALRARPDSVLGAIQQDVPGLREWMPPLRDHLGRVVDSPSGLLSALTPTVSDRPKSELDRWLWAMQDTPDKGVIDYPSRTPLGRTLTAEDYDAFQRARGEQILPRLEDMRRDAEKRGVPPAAMADAVHSLVRQVSEAVRFELVPGMEARALGLDGDEAALSAIRAVMADGDLRDLYQRDTNGDEERREILGLVLAAPRDREARALLREMVLAGNQAPVEPPPEAPAP